MMSSQVSTAKQIGTCRWAGHRFIATSDVEKVAYCSICEPVTVEAYGQPWTQRSSIKWVAVKARRTDTKCSAVCTSAKSDKCSCECAGENHGMALTKAV